MKQIVVQLDSNDTHNPIKWAVKFTTLLFISLCSSLFDTQSTKSIKVDWMLKFCSISYATMFGSVAQSASTTVRMAYLNVTADFFTHNDQNNMMTIATVNSSLK